MFSSQTEKISKSSSDVEMRNLSSANSSPSLQPTYVPSNSLSLNEDKNSTEVKNSKIVNDDEKEKLEIQDHELKLPKEEVFESIVQKSTLVDKNPEKQAENIKREFNKEINPKESVFTTRAGIMGKYLERDQFMLCARNRVPELALFSRDYNTDTIIAGAGTEIDKPTIHKHYDLFFGAHGSYVLNVPPNKYAKANSGNQPKLYGPGPHVIKDPVFTFDPKAGLVNQSDPVISNGNLHIIRVPRGSIAKIWIGNDPYILPYRTEPYVFNSPLLRYDANSLFVNAADPVVKHGTIYIVRVPAGSYVKAWDGSKPLLLESCDKPYIFNSEQFRLESQSGSYFVSAKTELIEHGSIKRVLPNKNRVAVVSNGGNIKIVGPRKDGEATIIDSPTEFVVDFISTDTQTLIFPSDRVKAERIKENRDPDEVNYEVFNTKDSLKIGVKLLVAYEITDPETVVRKFKSIEELDRHIENLANTDMGKAVQQATSQEFLTFYQTKPHHQESRPGGYDGVLDTPPMHYQDIVKAQLAKDLKEVGIKLVRFNIENPKPLNKEIAAKMEQQSLLAAEANAKEAILQQTYNIELAKAQREAAIKKVAQDQANEALRSAAEVKLKAAELEAQAVRITAQAKADALLIEAKAQQEAAALEGKILTENPALMQMRMLELKMSALQNIKFFPPAAGTLTPGAAVNPFMLFNQFTDNGEQAAHKPLAAPGK